MANIPTDREAGTCVYSVPVGVMQCDEMEVASRGQSLLSSTHSHTNWDVFKREGGSLSLSRAGIPSTPSDIGHSVTPSDRSDGHPTEQEKKVHYETTVDAESRWNTDR